MPAGKESVVFHVVLEVIKEDAWEVELWHGGEQWEAARFEEVRGMRVVSGVSFSGCGFLRVADV